MKLINRIMISSAFLVLLSLVLFLVIFAAIIFWIPASNEIMDENIFSAGKTLEEYSGLSEDWDALNTHLSKYGYKLLVLEDGKKVFSGLDVEANVIESLKTIEPGQSLLIGNREDMIFTAKKSDSYLIFAVKDKIVDNASLIGYIPWLLLFGLIAFVIILPLSLLFTRKMAWRILRPLNALSQGAERIKNGDLSNPIIYNANDEFASVCIAFNHMQEHLIEEQNKNAAYEKARTDLIAGVSHDLRTPLTSVKGFIKGLRDGVAATPEKQEQYLSIAYQKACDMDVLLQQLFFFSNLETGNLPMIFSTQDFGDFSIQFAEDIRSELEYKNVVLAVEATSVPHPVKIDMEQMRRVFLNLIENAVRYAETKPLAITIKIWRERGMEHLLFADNGQGVPESQLPHIFERVWQGDESRSTKNKDGSGLGLYIVKYIVEAHGGFITARNDNGLAIEITLPCEKEEKNV